MASDDVDQDKGPDIGSQQGQSGFSRTPVPDPTVLTSQALYREVAGLKELITDRIKALDEASADARQAILNELHIAIEARDALDAEKDKRIAQQFDLVERQRVEQKKDTKDAVDAALAAAKEAMKEQTTASERATNKSETAINKLVEQQALTFKADIESQRRATDENKERIGELERSLRAEIGKVDTKVSGVLQNKQGGVDSRAVIGWAVAAIVGILAIVGFAIDLAARSSGG